jgi:hypothetical protein
MLSLLFKLPAFPGAVTGEQQSMARTVAGAMMMGLRSQRNEYPAPVRLDLAGDGSQKAGGGLWMDNSALHKNSTIIEIRASKLPTF